MSMATQLYINARIATPVDRGAPATGPELASLSLFDQGALLVEDGIIKAVGDMRQVRRQLAAGSSCEEIDCAGRCLVPGLVDPHTHLCFATPREKEFGLRLAGTPYLEIMLQGGGILSSVSAVASMDEERLFEVTAERLATTLSLGTTSIEIKSGYGLATELELKMLRVIGRLQRECPSDVVATFLGAHAIPPQYKDRADAFIDLLIDEMLPAVDEQNIAAFCDVFCEEGVFSINQSRRLLQAAAARGFGLKIHADEVHDLGGAALAAELRARSADHLLAASRTNLRKMAAAGCVAVLLPATAFSLKKKMAPARQMIEDGLAIALATDCNPGSSYCESMQFAVALGVVQMGLSPAEALVAATLNAAYAINLADRVGSLEPGKQADFLILDGESPAIFAYHHGVSVVREVYKHGRRVYAKQSSDILR
jgi:imidazolonepropionase